VILLTSAHAPFEWTGRAAPGAIAAMPLEEKIALIAFGMRDHIFDPVTSHAFRRAAAQTGLHVYSMKKTAAPVAVTEPGLSAARAVIAGYDLLLDVTDADAVFWGIAAAVERGELSLERIDAAVARVLLTARAASMATR
jgi:hypothetical protein